MEKIDKLELKLDRYEATLEAVTQERDDARWIAERLEQEIEQLQAANRALHQEAARLRKRIAEARKALTCE